MLRMLLASVALTLWLVSTPLIAQIKIPAGARVQMGSGMLEAGGVNLEVAGQFLVSAGQASGLGNVSILGSGLIDGGSGLIRLSGDWQNAGSFVRGTGLVDFVDGAVSVAMISGNSAFYGLSFVSAVGKRYLFAPNSEQRIESLLRIRGTGPNPIQIASSLPPQVARLNLAATGAQDIAFDGVSNVYATGQPLAPTLTNQGGTGNANGWFGLSINGEVRFIPTLNGLSLALMALLFGLLAGPALSRFTVRS